MKSAILSYLALGDSYTIGEGVVPSDNFPNQLAGLLHRAGIQMSLPRIVAKTGWTTTELAQAIKDSNIDAYFDIVTLLIGVNDQYRGMTAADYEPSFTLILETAIRYARNYPDRVFVLSIPDWSATPFAMGRDRNIIAGQIDAFNEINRNVSKLLTANYIEITEGSREAFDNPQLVTTDKLHPSAMEYSKWAGKLAAAIVAKSLLS